MGMFDYVNGPMMDCPACGAPLQDEKAKCPTWQSKDGPCELETLQVADVDTFYTFCTKCKAWIQFNRREREEDIVPGFEMTVETKEEAE